jgi:O-antigen/teichoic acid export membrane protein
MLMTFVFGMGQAIVFVMRYFFKISFGDVEYGIFAFLVTSFTLFVTASQFALTVPIVARISANPEDEEDYQKTRSQIASTNLILSIIIASVFIVWTYPVTGDLPSSLLFGSMVIFYSSSVVMHAFPRGRDKAMPVIRAIVITGVGRVSLLALFIVGFFATNDVFLASIIYAVPLFGWWASYIVQDGLPRIRWPNIKSTLPYYKEGFMALITEIGVQIPVYLGIVALTFFAGFAVAGDFDIALLFYSGFAVVLTGISFAIRNKARMLPDFHAIRSMALKRVALPLFLLSIAGFIIGVLYQTQLEGLLLMLQLPTVIFWPAVVLILTAIPMRVIVTFLGTYFQGRGAIKQVGIMTFGAAVLLIPVHLVLILILGPIGAAIGIALVNGVTALAFFIFGETRFQQILDYSDSQVEG